MDLKISKQEKSYLRELAKEQLEISALPIMAKRAERFTKNNDLRSDTPVVIFEMWYVLDKGFLPEPKCESEAARTIENTMLRNMCNYKAIDDDTVVPSVFNCYYQSSFLPFSLPAKRVESKDVGYHIEPQIFDLSKDKGLLRHSKITLNKEKSIQWRDFVSEIIGDILPVNLKNKTFNIPLTNDITHLMSMENMFIAMMDTPEEFHFMMDILTSDYIEYMKTMQEEGMLTLNNGNDAVEQGTYGFTNELPSKNYDSENIKTTDCWGHMNSQETVGISPSMFHEFIFPYYKRIAEYFGFLSYGCCENVIPFWEDSISRLPNLRKISISPWCDEEVIGERLRGSKIIYHRKPSPSFIGLDKSLNEEAFREHIKKTLKAAQGCALEITFRDTYNLNGQFDKPRRAVEIVREEIEKHWRPL